MGWAFHKSESEEKFKTNFINIVKITVINFLKFIFVDFSHFQIKFNKLPKKYFINEFYWGQFRALNDKEKNDLVTEEPKKGI